MQWIYLVHVCTRGFVESCQAAGPRKPAGPCVPPRPAAVAWAVEQAFSFECDTALGRLALLREELKEEKPSAWR